MKIGINALSVTIGGGVTFMRNLVPLLAKLDSANEYYLFVAGENYIKIFDLINWPANVQLVKMKTYNLIFRIFQEQFAIPFLVWRLKIDLLVCSANISSILAPCKKLLWVLNIYPYFILNIKGESFIARLRFKVLRVLTDLSIRHSDLSVHISNFSRLSLLAKLKVPDNRMVTIYLGADTDALSVKSQAERETDSPYILSVSSISKRKNYEVLMKAYNKLPREIRDRYKIVLVGEVTEELKEYLRNFISDPAGRPRVVFTGKTTFAELYAIYKKASIFVMPSLVEAFGLPVIEAMAAGLPVLVAAATALPEIAGEAGLKFDPHDPVDLAGKIELVLTDKKLAEDMSVAGIKRAKLFTWERTAKETLACFAKIMARNERK